MMKRKNILLFVIVLSMLLYLIPVNTKDVHSRIDYNQPTTIQKGMLVDGIVNYNAEKITHRGSSLDPYGIEYYVEHDIHCQITSEKIGSNTVKFTKQITFSNEDFYQYYYGYYYPDYYQVRYYDEYENTITDSSSFTFNTITEVNLDSGSRISCTTPYNAWWAALYAGFSDYDIYPGLRSWYHLGDSYDKTDIFIPNSLVWVIGYKPYSGYTVVRFDEFQGYPTVVLAEDYPSSGVYSTFKVEYHYERYYGVRVKTDIEVEYYDYYQKYYNVIDDITALVDDGNPIVNGPTDVQVSSTDPITLGYTATDANYDHYNFYKDGSLIESDTAWKANFTFNIVPIEGNTTYVFEAVDSNGNTNTVTTLVSYVKAVPGYSFLIAISSILIILVIRRNLKNKK